MKHDNHIEIFGNPISSKSAKKAFQHQKKLKKRFKYDPSSQIDLSAVDNEILSADFGLKNIQKETDGEPIDSKNGIIIGTIRMGYGHYRIAMALASCAKSKGLVPYWFDLMSFENTISSKIIKHLNFLYSLGSKLSQTSELFNRFYWEPLNSESFKKLDYNASDLKMTELMLDVYKPLKKSIPFVASHAWPAQAAVAAGMKTVVNVIPDNWPMALHLAEGSIHTVQSESSYLGYRILREMGGKDEIMRPIPAADIQMTGHYIDHELVQNIEEDCHRRIDRVNNNNPLRLLISIGGAGAQKDTIAFIIGKLLAKVKQDKIAIFINAGDHINVWKGLQKDIPELVHLSNVYSHDINQTRAFVQKAHEEDIKGVHVFYDENIFSAVYTTNLLMRESDLLITKPSELAYYPIPKLFIKRVGGHEMWGSIRGAEIGDSTIECNTNTLLLPTLELLINEKIILKRYCNNIIALNKMGIYNGGYRVIELAMGQK